MRDRLIHLAVRAFLNLIGACLLGALILTGPLLDWYSRG